MPDTYEGFDNMPAVYPTLAQMSSNYIYRVMQALDAIGREAVMSDTMRGKFLEVSNAISAIERDKLRAELAATKDQK